MFGFARIQKENPLTIVRQLLAGFRVRSPQLYSVYLAVAARLLGKSYAWRVLLSTLKSERKINPPGRGEPPGRGAGRSITRENDRTDLSREEQPKILSRNFQNIV